MNVKHTKAEKNKVLLSDGLYDIMLPILQLENKTDPNREHFWVIGLDDNNSLLFIELIGNGATAHTELQPTDAFSQALQKKAAGIVLCHSQANGGLKPSETDLDMTDRFIQTGIIVKTPFIDHIIISEKSYFSFAGTGLLDTLGKSIKYVPPYLLVQRMEKEAEETGRKTDIKEAEKEIARNMKAKGVDPEIILEVTGISKVEIGEIRVMKK